MASKVQIANQGLTHLGVDAIASLTEDSEAARKVNSVFDHCVDEVLKSCDWNFARKTEALALLADESLEWDYVYQRPAKCLAVRKIFSEVAPDPNPVAKHEEMISPESGSQAIGADLEDAYVKFTYQVSDISTWPPDAVAALALKIAHLCAFALTGEKSVRTEMGQLFFVAVSQAKANNGNEGNFKSEPTSQYIDARG